MLYFLCLSLFVGLSVGKDFEFLLADGPTHISANSTSYFPYGDPKYDIKLKLIQVDPHVGMWVSLLLGSPGSVLGTHRHYGQVYGYTLRGAWGYREHPEWLSKPGDTVHETPGSVHTLYIDENHGETETLFFVWGSLEFLDESGNSLFIEDWRSITQKYVDYCEKNNLPVIDVTYPKHKVPDIDFHHHEKHEL